MKQAVWSFVPLLVGCAFSTFTFLSCSQETLGSDSSIISSRTSGSGEGALEIYTRADATFLEMVLAKDTAAAVTFPVDSSDGDSDWDDGTAIMDHAFYLASTSVTWELWSTVVSWATDSSRGTSVYTFSGEAQGGSDKTGTAVNTPLCPAVGMNWRDTIVFCNALTEYWNAHNGGGADLTPVYYTDAAYTQLLRTATDSDSISAVGGEDEPYIHAASIGNTDPALTTADGFRLLSRIEYDWASRWLGTGASAGAVYNDGSSYTSLTSGLYWTPGSWASGASAAFSDTASTAVSAVFGADATSEVASKLPNALGLYDMSGNVGEWLCDWYTGNSGSFRLYRGGSFQAPATSMTKAPVGGYYLSPEKRVFTMGFRLARNAD